VPRRFGALFGAGETIAAVVLHIIVTFPLAVAVVGSKLQTGKSTALAGETSRTNESGTDVAPESVIASVAVPEPP
jgi:hypothetical protein